MKTLVLSNGVSYEFADDSSITYLRKELTQYGDVDAMLPNMTEENLCGAEFDGVVFTNVVPVSCSVSSDIGGTISAVFTNREKSEMEMMHEEITELQEAVAEIANGI